MFTITAKNGQKIILRPPKTSDKAAMYTYAKKIESEDTFITLNPDEPLTKKEEDEFVDSTIKKIKQHKKVSLYAFHGSKIIGSAGIETMGRRKNHIGRFGIGLLEAYRSLGIGRQLMRATIDLAVRQLGIHLVLLEYLSINQIGKALYESEGFQQVGTIPKAVLYKGEYIDEPIMVKEITQS